MNGWINEWMNQWMDESMNGWINEWINQWMDGWINEWMNQWNPTIHKALNPIDQKRSILIFSPTFWTPHTSLRQTRASYTSHWGRLGRPTHHNTLQPQPAQESARNNLTSGAFFYLHGNFRKDVLNFLLSFNTIKSRIKSYLIPIFCDLNYFFLVIFRLLIS